MKVRIAIKACANIQNPDEMDFCATFASKADKNSPWVEGVTLNNANPQVIAWFDTGMEDFNSTLANIIASIYETHGFKTKIKVV